MVNFNLIPSRWYLNAENWEHRALSSDPANSWHCFQTKVPTRRRRPTPAYPLFWEYTDYIPIYLYKKTMENFSRVPFPFSFFFSDIFLFFFYTDFWVSYIFKLDDLGRWGVTKKWRKNKEKNRKVRKKLIILVAAIT